jgi:hypothetical protein
MNNLTVSYDRVADSLRVTTDETAVSSDQMVARYDWVVLDFAKDATHSEVVGLEVLGASALFPLGRKSYDRHADALILGTRDGATAVVNGDLVVYWGRDPDDPEDDEAWPIGLEIRSASKWFLSCKECAVPADVRIAQTLLTYSCSSCKARASNDGRKWILLEPAGGRTVLRKQRRPMVDYIEDPESLPFARANQP